MRRLSARVPSAYICALLQIANKAVSGESVEEITVEQKRYFDLSNDRGLEGLLTALLEDDDQIVKESEGLDLWQTTITIDSILILRGFDHSSMSTRRVNRLSQTPHH